MRLLALALLALNASAAAAAPAAHGRSLTAKMADAAAGAQPLAEAGAAAAAPAAAPGAVAAPVAVDPLAYAGTSAPEAAGGAAPSEAGEKKDPRPQLWRLTNLGGAVHSGASPAYKAVSSPAAFAAEARATPSFLFVHGMNFKGTPADAFNDQVAHWEAATGAFRPGGGGGCTDATCNVYILVRCEREESGGGGRGGVGAKGFFFFLSHLFSSFQTFPRASRRTTPASWATPPPRRPARQLMPPRWRSTRCPWMRLRLKSSGPSGPAVPKWCPTKTGESIFFSFSSFFHFRPPPWARPHAHTGSAPLPHFLPSPPRPPPPFPLPFPLTPSIYGSAWREQERRGAVAGAYLAPFLGALPPAKAGVAGSSAPFTVVSHSLGAYTVAAAGQILYRPGGAAEGTPGRVRSWKLCAGALPDNAFAPGGRFTAAPALVGGPDAAAGIDVFYSAKDDRLSGPYERATDLTAMGRAGSTVSGGRVPPSGAAITNINTLESTGSTHNTQKGYFEKVGGARLMAGVPTAQQRGA